jgi:undecaprenyl-diphosphatase
MAHDFREEIMPWWQAIVLGALQGVTEFLPVSSSGHLVLAQHFLGFGEEGSAKELFFDGVLHLGTLLAVLAYFGREWLAKDSSHSPPEDASTEKQWPHTWKELFHLGLLISLATLPAAVMALWKSDWIKESFQRPVPVAINFFILGGILLITDRLKPGQTSGPATTWRQALLIGLAQGCSALCRGLSRSGMTIAMALLTGLERRWAVRFSFFMSIVTSLGLGGLGILKALRDPHREQWLTSEFLGLTLLAMAVSAAVAYLTIGPLIRVVQKARLWWFAVYLWIVAAMVLITKP